MAARQHANGDRRERRLLANACRAGRACESQTLGQRPTRTSKGATAIRWNNHGTEQPGPPIEHPHRL
eukprot:8718161-Alexandrium_andersonii.AAC.1